MSDLTANLLWNATLSARDGEPVDSSDGLARSRLRDTLLRMRERVSQIVGEIPRDLPHFTVHDVTHLDGLWDMAEAIAGQEFVLTPTEAFAFGGAVLLHDSAMTLAAYSGREKELRQDPMWKDAAVLGLRKALGRRPTAIEVSKPPDAIAKAADEETLRMRHAEHAERVATQAWKLANDEPAFVIQDDDLRMNYGALIGRLAHSHWWNIDRVAREFGTRLGAPAWAPRTWTLDPLKIACLLRVADAAHLDARRAPAFLAAMRHIEGVSADHWTFQARMGKPHVEHDQIVYSAAKPFSAAESDAWWQCFDALRTLDHEIRQSDALLLETGRQRFCVRSVAGADAPARLRKHVPTDEWEPLDLKVKVTDVPALVERLGGKELYGNDPKIVLRELIQNALDAVQARRILERRPHEWGEITVELGSDARGEWLEVGDTGIGMSADVLSGPLLDFGVSYWTTSLSREEHPGLVSLGFEPIGRFGIGFFSVFMLGDRVRVSTRRPQDAMQATRVLEFGKGVRARPVLRKATGEEELLDPGTRVRIWLRNPPASQDGLLCAGRKQWTLGSLCGWLAPASSVNILVVDKGVAQRVVAANDWQTIAGNALLDRVWANGALAPFSPYEEVREECAKRLRPLTNDNGDFLGRATVIPTTLKMDAWRSSTRAGVVLVGGLNGAGLQGIAGILLGEPVDAARRLARPTVDNRTLAAWATEQAELVATYALPAAALESCAAIIRSCGGDPKCLPIARHQGKWRTFATIAGSTLGDKIVLVGSSTVYLAESPHEPGSLVLDPNVLAVEEGIPGILMSDRDMRDRVDWPLADEGTKTSDRFHKQTLSGLVVEAVAAAWQVPVSEVVASAKVTTDERTVKHRIGTLRGTPIVQSVNLLTRPVKAAKLASTGRSAKITKRAKTVMSEKTATSGKLRKT